MVTADGGCDLTAVIVNKVNEKAGEKHGVRVFQTDDPSAPKEDPVHPPIEYGKEERVVELTEEVTITCAEGMELDDLTGLCVDSAQVAALAEARAEVAAAPGTGSVRHDVMMGFTFAPPRVRWGLFRHDEVGFESCPTSDGDAIVALEARIAALEALLPEIPSSGIILWDSTSTCPTGYTPVTTAYVGGASLDNSYLRATSGAGAGTVSGNSSVSPAISATSTGTVGTTDLAHTHPVSGFSTNAQHIVAAYREGTGGFTITGDHNHALNVTSGAPSASMNHTHSVLISTTASVTVDLAPLGYGVLMCRKI